MIGFGFAIGLRLVFIIVCALLVRLVDFRCLFGDFFCLWVWASFVVLLFYMIGLMFGVGTMFVVYDCVGDLLRYDWLFSFFL